MPPRAAKKSTPSAAPKKAAAKPKQLAKAEETAAALKAEVKEEPTTATAEEQKEEAKPAVDSADEPVKEDEEKPDGDKDGNEHDLGEDAEESIKEEATNMDTNEDGLGEDGDEEEGNEDDKTQDEEEGDGQAGEDDGAEEEEDQGEEDEGEDAEEGHVGGEGDEDVCQANDIPAPLKDRQKQKEFEIFVGGLNKDANEEDLKKVFGEVGEIKEVRMSRNPTTQKNKGFAFIRYATVEQAKKALTELKNPQVREKQCGVSPSQDNDTLYVGNICKTWTKETVIEKLKEYEVENFEEMALMDDTKNEGQNRGFVFLEFTTHQDAMNAFRRLQKRDAVFGCDRSAKVAFAENSIRADEEAMSQVKTVFIDGLTEVWDEERIKEEFKKYGEIEKVQLSRNMSKSKRKDYGFVQFTSREDALACVEGVNKSELGEGDIKIKANLAKPQHKGRGKQGFRGGYPIGDDSTDNKPRKGRMSRRFRSKGLRGQAGRGPAGHRGKIPGRGKEVRDGKKDKAAETIQDKSKSISKKDNEKKRNRDNEKRGRGGQVSGSRQDHNKSRRFSQSGRAPPRVSSRNLPYPRDSYTRHLELVNSYIGEAGRPYGAISGSKRPYSAVDDVPRYADPALRNSRARVDYDVGGASLYAGAAYGQSVRLGRAPEASYGGHPRGSYGYDRDVGYGRSSLAGAGVGGVYSSGYATSSIPGRTDIAGSSYSALYPSRTSGAGYLPGRGSGS
ncbi:hypothetical protein KI387_000337, partial [Taxus chinensis]